jgi:predicted enzyme related to lactoylglutathione lyase
MFQPTSAFSGFSVDDLAAAKAFYTEVLGLTATAEGPGLRFALPGGATVFAYDKSDHQPATYTMLNLVVDDIDVAVDALAERGVKFEHYDGMTDDKGVARGIEHQQGPNIAWFKDPAGNVLSVMQPA